MTKLLNYAALAAAILIAFPTGQAWAKHNAQAKATPSAIATPKLLGDFGSWKAALHEEAGKPACYAFAYPSKSQPKLKGRSSVVLSITNRPGERNAVALTAGYAYAPNAEPKLEVGKLSFTLYTAQSSAFAKDGTAVVKAFANAGSVSIHGPAARGDVTDRFSLDGFEKAYAAINKACPDK